MFGPRKRACISFHENPNRIHTELTFINSLKRIITNCMVLSSIKLSEASYINSMDQDQTAV